MACEKCRPATGLYKSASDISGEQAWEEVRMDWEGYRLSQQKLYLEAKDRLTGQDLEELTDSFNKFEGIYKTRYNQLQDFRSEAAEYTLEDIKKRFNTEDLPAVKFN